MMRSNSEAAFVKDPTIQGEKKTTLKQALTATLTLTNAYPDVLNLSMVAGQNVLLPLADATNDGRVFIITNTSAGAFSATVKDSTNTTTFGTVAQNKTSMFVNAAGTWVALTGA